MKELNDQYLPIDFNSYSIEDKEIILNKAAKLKEEDKIWRISSLTAFVDMETKILLLPKPESKRTIKIKDTAYTFNTIGDLVARRDEIEDELAAPIDAKESKRFEDKTAEELQEDVLAKRNLAMSRMATTRKWQFAILAGSLGFYFMAYRQFLQPKKIMNSVLYNDALRYLRANKKVA